MAFDRGWALLECGALWQSSHIVIDLSEYIHEEKPGDDWFN